MITECEFSWRPYVKAISSWTLSVLLNVSISIFSFFFKNVILLKHSWFISFCSKAKWFSYTDICYFSDSFPLSLITGYWAYSRASLFIHPICYCSGTQSYPALCDHGDCSTPGCPVFHCLPESMWRLGVPTLCIQWKISLWPKVGSLYPSFLWIRDTSTSDTLHPWIQTRDSLVP